ncbi:MAG: hypothetical protein ACI4F1_07625 [Bariatricus sp.]
MKRVKEESQQKKCVEVHYYNVVIYVEIQSGEDEYLISYLRRLIAREGQVTLRMILNWCRGHNLKTHTRFRIRWDFPIQANLMNLISYLRVLWEFGRDGE